MDKELKFGTKFDTDKPRFDLIPPDAELWVAKILAHGATKYAENNWIGLDVSRLIAAMKRHLNAIERGEDIDNDSKMPHFAHVATNAMMIAHILNNYPELDNRQFKFLQKIEK